MKKLIRWLDSNYTYMEDLHCLPMTDAVKYGAYEYMDKYNYLGIIYREDDVITTLTHGESDIKVIHSQLTDPLIYNEDGEVSNDSFINLEDYHFNDLNDAIRVFNRLTGQSIPMV